MDMEDIATSKELYPELNPKGLYHMLPPPNLFAAAMDAFDIHNNDRVSFDSSPQNRRGHFGTQHSFSSNSVVRIN
jgi:hypothetical protein